MIFPLISQNCIDLFFICVSQDAIFTTFATIFIFLIGYLINRWIGFSKEKKRLNEVENYFYSLVEQIKHPINDKIKILKEMADDIGDKKKTQFKCIDTINLDVTNLLNIAHSDLHKIFIVRKKGEVGEKTTHFTNMVNTLNYINRLQDNINFNYKNFNNSHNKSLDNWNKACNSIFRSYDNFKHFNKKHEILFSQDDFLSDFNRLIFTWKQYEDSKNICVTQEHFIIPLKKLCMQHEHERDERANTALPFVVTAEAAFESIESTKNTFKDHFQEDAETLKSKFESFESAVKYFRG